MHATSTGTQAFAARCADGQRLVVFRGTEPDSAGHIGTDLLGTLRAGNEAFAASLAGGARAHAT